MTVEVFDAVLALAVDGFVKLFPDGGALSERVPVVSVDVGNDDGEHLGVGANGGGGFAVFTRAGEHDDGIAEVDLDAADRVAVVEVFGETEDPAKPIAALGDVAVDEMRDNDVGGDRAVVHADSMRRDLRVGQGKRVAKVIVWGPAGTSIVCANQVLVSLKTQWSKTSRIAATLSLH